MMGQLPPRHYKLPERHLPDKPGMIVKGAITCTLCRALADRYDWGYQCQENPNHRGDPFIGMFSDFTD